MTVKVKIVPSCYELSAIKKKNRNYGIQVIIMGLNYELLSHGYDMTYVKSRNYELKRQL